MKTAKFFVFFIIVTASQIPLRPMRPVGWRVGGSWRGASSQVEADLLGKSQRRLDPWRAVRSPRFPKFDGLPARWLHFAPLGWQPCGWDSQLEEVAG